MLHGAARCWLLRRMLRNLPMDRIDGSVRAGVSVLRRHAAATFALWLALVVLSGALRSGASFVYCEMMQSFQHEACCAHETGGTSGHHEAELRSAQGRCCTSGTLPTIPSGQIVPSPESPRASLAVVPFMRHLGVLAAADESCTERLRRAPPIRPPPSRAESRARLMVFLT